MTCFASSIPTLRTLRLHDHSSRRWNGIGSGMAREGKVGSVTRVALRRGVALPVLVVASAVAYAQSPPPSAPIYSCVANGRTYSGDRPPPECVNSDIRELNKDGSVRRVIPRPMTQEEQKARALEAKKRLEEEEKVLAQRRRDRSLLEAYANESEIEAARVKALDTSNEVIRRSQTRIERMDAE